MTDQTLPHRLDRNVTIRAPRATVFAYFTDSPRWAAWWGPGSTIDPRPGGRVFIRHPNGVEAGGEIIEIRPSDRIVFTYGFASGRPIPVGASRVTITCVDVASGTDVRLVHEFDAATVRDHHVQGWRYQFSVFANVVANEVFRAVAETVDEWHAIWAETDATLRESRLAAIAAPDVRFEDRFSAVAGASELLPHIAATQQFMPGLSLRRDGDIRHCQGVVLADWIAHTADGSERGRGTNVYTLGADGRIQSVTGLWR
jgi:uncharacterized protein YndB with AHSA1/START domain